MPAVPSMTRNFKRSKLAGPSSATSRKPTRVVETVHTWTPAPVTLRQMGVTAQAAADTYTLREWAARLATRAGPKDYRGQLAKLYDGILERWRYVLEDGEWVHGSARSLLGTVLGTDYNCCPSCPSAERCDVAKTPWRERGWGDCDDVATLAAAGALSLGMRPLWRVSGGDDGRAHVSVAVVTPRGELVQLDPVGHPEHPFGWAQSGPGITVQYHALDGRPLAGPLDFGATNTMQPATPYSYAPQFYPTSMLGPPIWQAAPYGFGSHAANQGTYLGVLSVAPRRAGLSPYQGRVPRHYVVVSPADTRGSRVLAVPGWHARTMMAGVVVDGCPAVDQFGGEYAYSQPLDLWIPRASRAANAAMYGFGATRAERRAARKVRRRRDLKKVGRFFQKVGQGIRKVVGKIMGSKLVQAIVAGIAQVWGFPAPLMRQLMAVAAKFVGSGGFIALFKKLRKHPKTALKTLAKTVAAAGRSDLLKGLKLPGMAGPAFAGAGPATGYEPVVYQLSQQGGAPFYAATVEGIVGLDGAFGDAGEGGQAFAATPTPGYRYRVKKGDNLSDVAKAAYGKANPGARWISSAKANAAYARPAKTPYEQKYVGPSVASFLPKFGPSGHEYAELWIPPAEGVEPAVVPVVPDGGDDELDDVDDEPDDVSPGPVPVPPVPPVEPDDFDVDDEIEPTPGPPPPVPVKPVQPSGPDLIPDMPPLGPVPGYPPGGFQPSAMPPLGPVPGYPPGGFEDAHEQAHEDYKPPPKRYPEIDVIPDSPAEAVPPGGTRNDMPIYHPPLVIPSGPPRGTTPEQRGGELGLAIALASLFLA